MEIFKQLFTYKGRMRRRDYLIIQLGLVFLMFAMFIIAFTNFGVITFILLPLSYLINIFQTAKRLHDINISGWLSLIILVPIGYFIVIPLCFIPSSEGKNKFDINQK
ncbi:MAG: DUF805 domain-containing protein [Bacteroidetes bacterium]|nr:DUF805 domain-containing protein [Bacteroidota bacterium]